MIRRPPRSTLDRSSAASDVYKRQHQRGNGQAKLRELLATGRWRPVYSDAVAWLLARNATVPEHEMQPSAPGPWRDLTIAKNSEWAGNSEAALAYAAAVREVMPWHKGACEVRGAPNRKPGQQAACGRGMDQLQD